MRVQNVGPREASAVVEMARSRGSVERQGRFDRRSGGRNGWGSGRQPQVREDLLDDEGVGEEHQHVPPPTALTAEDVEAKDPPE